MQANTPINHSPMSTESSWSIIQQVIAQSTVDYTCTLQQQYLC